MQDPSASLEQPTQPGMWRFGQALLDEQVAALRVGGALVDLDRSAYDVLLALLRHAGEIVTKDELLEAGWPGRVVSENSLAKAVSRLRQALGEDGDALRVVHGYGYRLAAAVSFQAVPVEKVTAHPHAAERLHEGDRLPHRPGWRLGRRLGEGSAGVTFLALSDTGETRAVKLATSEAGLRSLKREIALARYIRAVKPELPGVAPVIDWNLSQPPFFLELPYFPEGHLADWAASAGGLPVLDLATRLSLCVHLCEAVAALHEIGIIHKDLKPENVYPLADDHGDWHVVLSDLGAGEAAQSPRWAELGITMSIASSNDLSSARAGSLLYMAPEVIAGEQPTQRSDVFALGMLVYQLVVGDLRRSIAPGWEADVVDELLCQDIALAAAANPDRRLIDARGLAERLRSLEVRRAAIASERQRSIDAMRLSGELALVSRRRLQWVAGSAVLSVVLALSVWQQHRTGQARAQAERAAARADAEAAKARGLVSFLTDDVLKQADPFAQGSGALTLRQALDRAARDVDQRFRDSPDVAAAVHGTLGAAYEGMSDYTTAVAEFRKQLASLSAQPARDPALVARAHGSLCTATLWQGDLRDTVAACKRAADAYRAAGLSPDRPEVMLAQVDNKQGRHQQTLARLQPRMARLRASGDDDTYGFALWFAAIAHARLGQPVETERHFADLVEVRRRQSGARSMPLAWSLAEHGNALLMLGRDAEGKARLQQADAMFRAVGGRDHPHAQVPQVHLATHEALLAQWDAAAARSGAALQSLLPAVSWDHWAVYAAVVQLRAEAERGRTQIANKLLQQMLEMYRLSDLPRRSPYLREPTWSSFAATYLALGKPAQARRRVEQLRSLLQEPAGATPLLQAKLACFDAELARVERALDAARSHARRCEQLYAAVVPAASPLLHWPRRLLAQLPAAVGPTPAAAR